MTYTGNATGAHDVRDWGAFTRLLELEPKATQIFLNQPLFLPGLLQVPGYAAEMIGHILGLKPGSPELAERVQVRTERGEAFQKRLRSSSPPHLWAAIDEAVVRRKVGGADVMRAQLDHLVAMTEFKTVHLAIIPLDHGAHAGLGGSFEVHELGNGDASVYFEGSHDDVLVGDKPELARRCRETVKSMVSSGSDARAVLEAISSSL
ncbi:DUF5753 domain-containing protein [Dactylosporangium sp. NBC_01737]|uniref:DUF5753 domain-containing protein n=1 Tax=Dactylosporangium sp. NBC_01737 TaxID=2975959 RepID=UPI002E0E1D21|nr:DUF5753 domain-containing protein [Dactylosporangium sp. NBC_01737]